MSATMSNCATCSAKLTGSGKFCAACGAPVPPPSADDSLRGPAAKAAEASSPNIVIAPGGYEPPSQVNPFATTASPHSPLPRDAVPTDAKPEAATPAKTSPSPSGTEGSAPSPVSPLAMSNALSQRGSYQQLAMAAMEKQRESSAGGLPGAKKPGTEMMASAPTRPPPSLGDASGSTPATPHSNAPEPTSPHARTVAIPTSHPPRVASQPGQPSAPYGTPPPMKPAFTPHPASHPQQTPHYPAPSGYAHAPSGPGGWGWNPPPVAQPKGGASPYAYGYVPGARVQVTWSNGQRYPATVSQVTGTQCLVVFPDGQQHWVEMHYLSPG